MHLPVPKQIAHFFPSIFLLPLHEGQTPTKQSLQKISTFSASCEGVSVSCGGVMHAVIKLIKQIMIIKAIILFIVDYYSCYNFLSGVILLNAFFIPEFLVTFLFRISFIVSSSLKIIISLFALVTAV